jgi:hypothetical protein
MRHNSQGKLAAKERCKELCAREGVTPARKLQLENWRDVSDSMVFFFLFFFFLARPDMISGSTSLYLLIVQGIVSMTEATMITESLLSALQWKYGTLGRQPRKFNPKCVTVSREDQELSEYDIFLRESGSRPQCATPRAQLP